MSRPEDSPFHDPARDDARRDALTLAALGEPLDPEFARHERECAVCRAELAGLAHTVELARGGAAPAPAHDVRPPATVWTAVARELGLPKVADSAADAADRPAARPADRDDDAPPPPPPVSLASRRHRRRSLLLFAVAAVTVVAAGVGGFTLGRGDSSSGTCPTARADLAPVAGADGAGAGRAEIVCPADGPALRVTTGQLPISTGYYEVWLYQPANGVMVGIGALGRDGTGTFTLPGGMDVRDYPVVDVSSQRFDGDPSHGPSVLQGPLTQ